MQLLAEQGRAASEGNIQLPSLQLAGWQSIMPELLALSPSHCSAVGLAEHFLVREVGFCRFSLIFTIRIKLA